MAKFQIAEPGTKVRVGSSLVLEIIKVTFNTLYNKLIDRLIDKLIYIAPIHSKESLSTSVAK